MPADRRRVPPEAMRVSDAERAEVAELLHGHFAEGRLDREEHEQRLSRALGATTRGELDQLLVDLPLPAAPVPAAPRGRRHRPRWLLGPLLLAVFVAVAAGDLLHSVFGVAHLALLVLVGAALFLWLRTGHRHRCS